MNELIAEQEEGVLEQLLLVDDNSINLQILYKTLQGCGYKLLTANDGETAVDIAIKARPSLILLDIMMPGMDGYEVCELLKARPETADIAVIFLSALEDSSAKVRGFSVGGVDYISKPFQTDEVVARVRNHIKIHRLERQLARRNVELETENHQILNAVSEGIIGLDREGRVTMLNPAATMICGWPAADCLGEQLSALGLFNVDLDQRVPEYQTLPYRSYRMGQSAHSDMELICRRDLQVLPVTMTSTPRSGGGAVIVLRDISEWVDSEEALRLTREELEFQRQKMTHMERLSTTGEMAAGIAHEVNQPLTAVANYSRVARRLLAKEPIDKPKLIELLDKLNTQSVRASDVIQRVRSYVKKPDINRWVEADINILIREVIALAEVDSRIIDVPVHLEPQRDLPLCTVDTVQIQQVALNLIRNAMDAMAESSNRQQGVLVTTQLKQDGIYVNVVDHGVGITEQASQQLFDPFYTTKESGMGIGLSICQSIVHAHGGRIGFTGNKDGGTTFYFSLPVS